MWRPSLELTVRACLGKADALARLCPRGFSMQTWGVSRAESGYSAAAVSPLAAGASPVASSVVAVSADLLLLAFRVAFAFTAPADLRACAGVGGGSGSLIAVTVAAGGAAWVTAVAGAFGGATILSSDVVQ